MVSVFNHVACWDDVATLYNEDKAHEIDVYFCTSEVFATAEY